MANDYRNAARCKSYSDSRQCWRNTSVYGPVVCLVGRARDLLDDVASTCVCGCRRVYDFACFVYLLHCSELYSVSLSLCMRFGAPRRLNLTAEIALASLHLLAHTCTQVHRPRNQPGRCLHTGWSGKGEYLCHSVFLFCFHTSLVRSE